ncbi:MAG: flagellar motor protein MotB [Rhodospirillaceae bacterium]|nr:flagellar motor protein MotB [Rhodospirillaceae bacterium]
MATKDQAPEPETEEEEEECPKCPPPGAPAWMATFADMATLLMAFFVLILSFAEMNVPKFKQISGSLKDSFGVQRIVPVVEQPKGTTVLSLNFSPSPTQSLTKEVTSDTQDETKKELKTPTDNDQSEGSNKLQEGDNDQEGLGGENLDGKSAKEAANERLAEALAEIAGETNIEVKMINGQVAVDMKAAESSPEEMVEKLQRIANAIQIAEIATDQKTDEILFAGVSSNVAKLISAISKIEDQQGGKQGSEKQNANTGKNPNADMQAQEAAEKLKVALSDKIGKGSIQVEKRDGKVFVTLGAGGAFQSGSAELTPEAKALIAKLSKDAIDKNSTLTITGHTDNVPIANFKYADNWELAAARASSVARSVQNVGIIGGDRIKIVSQGENSPVADNNSPAGREKNRRIEIEIDYKK